jgi:hypothetical protein
VKRRKVMDTLEVALYDTRNGIVGSRCTTAGMRLARKLGLVGYRRAYGEIKLTAKGWEAMHSLEAEER